MPTGAPSDLPRLPEVNEERDPILLIVERAKNRRLSPSRVNIHHDAHSAIFAIARRAREQTFVDRKPKPWEPSADVQDHECFVMDVTSLPPPRHDDDESGNEEDDASDLIRAVQRPDLLDQMKTEELVDDGRKFIGYGLRFETEKGPLTLLRSDDPARPLKQAAFIGLHANSLKHVEKRPHVILYRTMQMALTNGHIMSTAKRPMKDLFSDVDVALSEVPQQVGKVVEAMPETLGISDTAVEILRTVSSRRPAFALRLRRFPHRLQQMGDNGVTTEAIIDAVKAVGGDPALIFGEDGNFEFSEENVGPFLDVIEGRWYHDALGGEARRADSFSTLRF